MIEESQTYLVGPTIRLRAIEAADAASEPSWRPSWFPRALAVAEARIEAEYSGGDFTLIAVRRRDEMIVGSVLIQYDGAWVSARPYAAPWLNDEESEMVLAGIV
ncbi:MAG: hypothetical protein IT339_06400, partial [Thermomicrobiales bacterium]|nr:hypothetical protein [Thermomicrobiales bacterium]